MTDRPTQAQALAAFRQIQAGETKRGADPWSVLESYLTTPTGNLSYMRDALIEAKSFVDQMEDFTGNRSDDETIWSLQAKIDRALTSPAAISGYMRAPVTPSAIVSPHSAGVFDRPEGGAA